MTRPILTALLAAPLLAACASTGEAKPKGVAKFEGDPRLGKQVDKICFRSTLDGFSQNTRDTVVVETGPSTEYLIEVRGSCTNLSSAQSLAVTGNLSCIDKFDSLIVSTSAFSLNDPAGIGPERCIIKAIYEWDEDAEVSAEAE